MTRFDERWRRLMAAARRAPVPEVAPPAARAWLRSRSEPVVEATWSWPLRAVAASAVIASLLALPWLGDALAEPAALAPSLPRLSEMATPRFPAPPRLPPPPTLPDVQAVVRTFTGEEPAP